MKVFQEYGKYYDLLYRDKDYSAESEYIAALIKSFNPKAETILELGCGTGKHASLLNKKGYTVFGVDLSQSMLSEARKLNVDCTLGDVRTFRANKTFDAVISLFHVASYQTSNEDIKDYFNTMQLHLNPGGIIIFDCWYGPAVINLKPEVRFQKFEDDFLIIEKKATPIHNIDDNLVDVHYDISIQNKSDNSKKCFSEIHNMRYYFKPELEEFLAQNNIELINSEEWMSKREPNEETWGVCFVGVKK